MLFGAIVSSDYCVLLCIAMDPRNNVINSAIVKCCLFGEVRLFVVLRLHALAVLARLHLLWKAVDVGFACRLKCEYMRALPLRLMVGVRLWSQQAPSVSHRRPVV